jgi:NADH:ubiquinone oxidoreductase subunit 4 (subunit M)
LLNWPDVPLWCGLVIAFAIRNPVIYFSKWYPDYHRRKFTATSRAH